MQAASKCLGGGPPGAGLRGQLRLSGPAWLRPLAPVPGTLRREGGREEKREAGLSKATGKAPFF